LTLPASAFTVGMTLHITATDWLLCTQPGVSVHAPKQVR
jgi:hypothetical protein